MTDREKLIGLAERCEAAQGPDRELDIRICTDALNKSRLDEGFQTAPAFTASLDAAMTLVPEGWTAWGIWSRNRKTRFYAILSRLRDDLDKDELDEEEDVRSWRCVTPALALCAAALRARAHTSKETNNVAD